MSPKETVLREAALINVVTKRVEKKVTIRRNAEIEKYLEHLLSVLNGPKKNKVRLIKEVDEKWMSFSLPGSPNLLFLPASILKKFQFESELAAILAFELSKIGDRDIFVQLTTLDSEHRFVESSNPVIPESIPLIGDKGIFGFTEKQLLADVDATVSILYQAGYDPRGLVGYLNILKQDPKKSPFSAETLVKLIERSHRAIDVFAPLRNPIVRSKEFMKMQPKLSSLR